MQMALTTHLPAYSQELLATTSQWFFRESATIPRDLSRYCKANSLIEFRRDDLDLPFGLLVSSGCSHVAAIEVNPARRTIKVTLYHANEGFQEKWSATHIAPESEFTTGESWSDYDKGALHGGVTEDGRAVLLVYRPKAGATRAYLVNSLGFTWRKPPSDTHLDYSSSIGIASDDSEHLFYVRSGTKFGRNGEAKVVEAYSIRHLACARAETFGFGDGYHMRNIHILEHLRLKSPLYVAIETSSFGGTDDERNSPPLVASSDRKIHWNFSNIGGGKNCFVSPDDRHLFHIERNEAMLHHWDLKKLSLKPLGSVRLPGVESSQSRPWLIHGKETTMKDAIDEQIHNVRYSLRCKVITVVTVNSSTVVVNVLSTFNQQLIYHETIRDDKWPNYVPLRIGFNETTGLNIFSMYPTRITRTPQGLLRLFGMSAVLISLPDIFKKIKAIENYFDHLSDQLTALPGLVAGKKISPTYKYEWKPGVMERNDESAIPLVQGRAVATNAIDARRQQEFYTNVYAHPNSSWRQDDTPDLRRFFVPHLFSFSYPWASDQRVSVFGAIMKNEYHIISIGPSPSSPSSKTEVIRVLYATDIKISIDAMEHIEFYQSSGRWVLRVYKMGDSYGSYSGAPMPIPRWTIVSPHFLEEDAWYDTFVLHRGAHVTMPGGWSTTPNFAITSTVNFYAYFLPHTVVAHSQVDYGLRTSPAYVLPKHLLWKEYGLRGLKPSNPNDIWFGGGRYADTLGPYFRSIYDDRSYDDGHPLFPSTFAMACNADYRAQNTMLVDAFFRRYKQDRNLLLENSATLSCAFPLACKARPSATLSFMRHIALYRWVVNDIGAVEVKLGATKSRHNNEVDLDNKWQIWRVRAERIWEDVRALVWPARQVVESEPNQRQVTLPLPGFCSFNSRLYKPPPVAESSRFGDCFWEFVLATSPYSKDQNLHRWEGYLKNYVVSTSRGPASPFTRLVEEIVDMKDRDLQLSYLNIAWLEKLLAWKMRRFALRIYLTRTALPMLVLFAIHLAVGILLTGGDANFQDGIGWWVILLVTIELAASCFILSVKIRQAYRIPRLFFGSIFNYVDTTALCLGIAMFFQVATKHAPPRAFLGFSTLLIWIAAILMLRIHKRVGMLLLLLTETIQGIFSFLVLLFFIILGFAFVPFLLLRNIEGTPPASNPFSSFPITFTHILNFISSDYGALEPFQDDSSAVRTLRALYIIIITVLFLNILIAMLNLKIKEADKNAANLYHLQMASLQVEIELGLLSFAERERRDWFPTWFTYSMTETEQRTWEDYLRKNKLKWDEDNDFAESKDNAPPPPPLPKEQGEGWANLGGTATEPLLDTEAVVEDDELYGPVFASASQQKTSTDVADDDSWTTEDDTKEVTPLTQSSSVAGSFPSTTNEGTPNTQPPASKQSKASLAEGASSSRTAERTPANDTAGEELACKVCRNPGKSCLGCGIVAYCSKEHQKQDWKTHKVACKGKGKA